MFSVLANQTYRHLFSAQVIALFGTGLMTVGLALLAFDLAGDEAGAVLGTALAIKMIVYVGISPIAAAYAGRFPRRMFLVTLDIVRSLTAIALPFVDAIWQIYVLIALLQTASAAFTPAFQASIPDILPDEKDYTNALSLSRMAYDLENLLSPMIAAVLVGLVGFHWLFGGTVAGFLISAALILTVRLVSPRADEEEPAFRRTVKGLQIYLKTPRLRGLLALNLAVAASGAMVIVNGVVIVKSYLGFNDTDLALSMAAYGGGSMVVALTLPKLLASRSERTVMLAGGALLPVSLLIFAGLLSVLPGTLVWPTLLLIWFAMGAGMSAVLVPSGRLLKNSAHPQDRPLVFAAQFALSHGCWLIAYPLAGWLGANTSLSATMVALAGLAVLGWAAAAGFWPAEDQSVLDHTHPDLPANHPHLAKAHGKRHAHAFVIDSLHHTWPDRPP
ncbi:probable NreB protein [Stappia aggregata IAM 12614]|uniref:Probable NreB protein n=1 Tax=Roseibium aggregatum (strain ATCC 25650 / DSM 13394 / JCM 20685 / NBRC 16684 / NCIMB 2208 / IAM 12614 / B1) TaxID=384765 RepID=A0P0D5_ROSAI|nr:MFS transporter [Roseibium aggregatum]EAV41543.1 probable NreB protein [Stappia aggregata IAM 12614] [Roseibium aggregatum IAM 12614]